jgi:hypothetical protein
LHLKPVPSIGLNIDTIDSWTEFTIYNTVDVTLVNKMTNESKLTKRKGMTGENNKEV